MPTYSEYMQQIEELKVLAAAAQKAELADARAQIQAIMKESGLTPADILENKKPAYTGPKTTIPPVYKDPDSNATWSGRGRAPVWIAEKDRTLFLIAKA